MLRVFLSGLLGAALVAGVGFAQEEKKPADTDVGVRGTYSTWKDGTLTIRVAGEKGTDPRATEFRVPEGIKIYTWQGTEQREVPYATAFREVRPDTPVFVYRRGGKIAGVYLNPPPTWRGPGPVAPPPPPPPPRRP